MGLDWLCRLGRTLVRLQHQERDAQRGNLDRLAGTARRPFDYVDAARPARGVVGERTVARHDEGAAAAGRLRAREVQLQRPRDRLRVDDRDRERGPVLRPRRHHVERRRRTRHLDRHRPEVLAVEGEREPRRLQLRLGGRRLDRADHVHGLRVIGHVEDVAVAEELVQAGGDPEAVLQEVARAELAVLVRAVPVVPLVEGHADRLPGERRQVAAVARGARRPRGGSRSRPGPRGRARPPCPASTGAR